MKNYTYQNNLIGKKQLRQILSWSFNNYNSMQACSLADELKYLGFHYASQAGISISIEDLKIPFVKSVMLEKANQEITIAEKIYLKGRIANVERFQKIIDTWSLTSESLKNQIIYYFKNYDPLNSVYIMAFSGARGNLSQVRQLVGMRGLMSDPSGEILNLPIKKNFREGLTITDYLMSGYGARKGIVDTALKTANSGYLTRRLIDVSQDILIREKDCLTDHSFVLSTMNNDLLINDNSLLGRVLNKAIFDPETKALIAKKDTQITSELIQTIKEKKVPTIYTRSPLTCTLYRSVCQKCYGWDLASETIVDIGEAIGILAGQSIGEPGTQLTMRTFHTGGIFTAKTRQQIINPTNGVIQYLKNLKTIVLRTNRGEDVLVTKNSGSVILIPDDEKKKLIQIDILRNTILFPKNNQYILKDMVIGESINTNRQIKIEVKPILSETAGEIIIPALKKKIDLINTNRLIWILSGQFYNSPKNSYVNFHSDYKLNRHSYIFRTKVNAHYSGTLTTLNFKKNLYQSRAQLTNDVYCLPNSKLQRLKLNLGYKNYLLSIANSQYLIRVCFIRGRNYLKLTKDKQLGILVSKLFYTPTGGTIYYNFKSIFSEEIKNRIISYFQHSAHVFRKCTKICFKTIAWLGEETYFVDCAQSELFVDHGDFISKGFELIPNLFSKTCGLVSFQQRAGQIQTVSIKSGLVYEGEKFKNLARRVYYPGERIISDVTAKSLTFCESIVGKKTDQLLVRPIKLYELPYSTTEITMRAPWQKLLSSLNWKIKKTHLYKTGQAIKSAKHLNLILNSITVASTKETYNNVNIELVSHKIKKLTKFKITEKLNLINHIAPGLKYKNIKSCCLIQPQQFVSNYATISYLEAVTSRSSEIIKFKIQKSVTKKILLISNNDCLKIQKTQIPKKKLNDFIIDSSQILEIGKIIVDNGDFFTLQKGRPYFFPNCKDDNLTLKSRLQYKPLLTNRFIYAPVENQKISLNYFDITKLSITSTKYPSQKLFSNSVSKIKLDFTKFFCKYNGKLYSSLVPQFFKKFATNQKTRKHIFNDFIVPKKFDKLNFQKLDRTLLVQGLEKVKSPIKDLNVLDQQLMLLKFVEQPLSKSTKTIGLYSLADDYFDQDVNSVFCKNNQFIEAGVTIGLLNLEKEITGDIVQGLPRIEEILEARKKTLLRKNVPMSQKKSLLVQITSLDPNFEFKEVGMTIRENDKVNPHKLLRVYFNYYGLTKNFFCFRTKTVRRAQLVNNYEGSYKSFKKVQLFILNSVQSIYHSQGVTINDKHLEVIIKQMTTKGAVTYEGDTPLLRREILELHHINCINKTVQFHSKQQAIYVPALLGITKAALNNPSFISSASFQETTRVLTKAAIEGRIDWLRGLKENIIIGHLIPAGTGTKNYRNGFAKNFISQQTDHSNSLTKKSNYRQVF